PTIDTAGRLWLSHRGRAEVYESLEALSRGRVRPLATYEPFAPLHYFPQEDGCMWFGRPDRFVKYDPTVPMPAAQPLRTVITRVVSPLSGQAWFPGEGRSTLPPLPANHTALIVHFTAPGAPVGRAVTFELQTDDNQGWINIGATGYTMLSNLGAGRHVIRIRPRDKGEPGQIAELAFTVLAPWYQTPGAYAGFILTAVVLIALLFTYHSRRQKHQKARLAALVDQRTHELNEANAALQRQIQKTIEEFDRRRRVEAQLHQSQKLESLGTLAGGIAHDFNNILAAIRGHTELALLDAPRDGDSYASLLEIRAAASRARDLVARILTFSRHKAISPRPVDLATVLHEALSLVRPTLPPTIELRVDLRSVHTLADETQMHQVILNLCSNASHAIGRKEGVIEIHLYETDQSPPTAPKPADEAQRTAATSRWAVIEVRDTGPGMDEETLTRIFDPFFTTKPVGQGTGLGLSTVRGIITQHDGFITVESTPGRGTTFRIYLPATEASPHHPTPAQPTAARANGEEIIVVDDERSVATATARLLQNRGFSTTAVNHPSEALEIIRAAPSRFQAAVIDLSMPGMSGTDLAARIRQVAPHMRFIFVSGLGHPTNEEDIMVTFGSAQFLPKPFEPGELFQAILDALEAPTSH
ncbi:MAG: response regulator, partial [Verrucomicrobia bacterium]